jgi:hypothetical protein
MQLSRIDRQYAPISVVATDPDGFPETVTGIDVALIPHRSTPTDDTGWTAAAADGDRWRVLLAGPDASPSGAIVVPEGGGDLWIRVTDNPEVIAVKVERITVT